MPINAPWNYPTLMCTPPGRAGGVFPTETVLPLEPEAYAVTQEGEIWRVTVKHSGGGAVLISVQPHPLLWVSGSLLRGNQQHYLRFSAGIAADGLTGSFARPADDALSEE